ncbi:HAD family hydrolase [Bdellovibrio bacteriovorus]|uniref:Putative phosphatase n=1 Tax=Bdellovibrio bacteriovorus str. Tiberius TaxID=1069642 RepID=K7YRE3_BDEBC|nr:HAD family phosphatase [Bdellovibrio bacteriovorus]AFY02421.1 putative phosphatase [Bdellovibrio bacteriovorus str. Tiberius]
MLNKFFPDQSFKALLFDFDGTVADTMPAHLAAWNKALDKYDLSLSRDQHMSWAGRPTARIVEMMNQLHKTDINPEQFVKEKEAHYLASLGDVTTIKSVMEIIQHYHGQIPMAIVTGSRRKIVELTMNQLGIQKYFDTLVCAEDYTQGKPAPDCFLMAAAKIQIAPADCLAFEDAVLGIEAAHTANMNCLKVTDDHSLVHTR